MTSSPSSADLIAMSRSEEVGFILTATITSRQQIPCKDGTRKTVTKAVILASKSDSKSVKIDGETWSLKYKEYKENGSVILERWSETPEQAKHNATVLASKDEAAAKGANVDIPA
jgi:hypothetical protein